MTRDVILLLALAGSALSVRAQAQDRRDPWMQEVAEALGRARSAVPNAMASGAVVRYGMLTEGNGATLSIPLEAGRTYVVVATCDRDCGRLALRVTDGRRYELDADRSETRQPALQITPAVGGPHSLEVVMASCGVGPCRYGVMVVPTGAPAAPPSARRQGTLISPDARPAPAPRLVVRPSRDLRPGLRDPDGGERT